MPDNDTNQNDRYEPDWCIGATSPKKVVHHAGCRHARMKYTWARQFESVEALADALVLDDAQHWHHFCAWCAGDIAGAVRRAERRQWGAHNHDGSGI